MTENRREPYWDNAKGILVLLVVLGHLLERTAGAIPESYYLWSVIYSFHMPAFILVGAYLCGRSGRDPVERVPKYIFLYAGVQYFVHAERFFLGMADFWGGDLSNPVKGAWYLLFLVYTNVVLFFLKKYDHILTIRHRRYFILVLTVALGILSGFDRTITNRAGIVRLIVFMPVFLLGYFWNLPYTVSRVRRHRVIACCIGGILILLMLYLQYRGIFQRRILSGSISYKKLYPEKQWLGALLRSAWYICSTFLALTILSIIPVRKNFMTAIGRQSLWIYISHIAVIVAVYAKADQMISLSNVYLDVLVKSGVTLFIIFLFTILVISIKNVIKRKLYQKRSSFVS